MRISTLVYWAAGLLGVGAIMIAGFFAVDFPVGGLAWHLEPFLVSAGVVGLAEIGDKTQLLALLLAAKFRRPLPILLAILAATLANHLVAGVIGTLAGRLLAGPWFTLALGLSFLAAAVWALWPDRLDEGEVAAPSARGVFTASAIAFFLAEIGDKTQLATIALAARYEALVPVVLGTTCGMLLANAPAVLFGQAAATRLPLKWIRLVAAAIFALLGVLELLSLRFH